MGKIVGYRITEDSWLEIRLRLDSFFEAVQYLIREPLPKKICCRTLEEWSNSIDSFFKSIKKKRALRWEDKFMALHQPEDNQYTIVIGSVRDRQYHSSVHITFPNSKDLFPIKLSVYSRSANRLSGGVKLERSRGNIITVDSPFPMEIVVRLRRMSKENLQELIKQWKVVVFPYGYELHLIDFLKLTRRLDDLNQLPLDLWIHRITQTKISSRRWYIVWISGKKCLWVRGWLIELT